MKATWKKIVLLFLATILIAPVGWVPTAKANTNTNIIYHETFASDPTTSNPVKSGSVKTEHVTDVTFAGNDDGNALYLYDRENTWDGLDFLYSSLGLQNGVTYDVTIRGYVEAGIEVPEGSVASLQPIHIANSTYSAGWVASAPLVAGEPFTLSGSFTADTATHAELRIGSSEDGAAVPFYIGDVLITSNAAVVPPSEPEDLLFFDFEDNDLNDWVRRNGAGNIEVTDEANFTEGGQYSLKTTVSEQYDGALRDVVGLLERGNQYRLSARVKMAEGQSPTTFRISVQYGTSSFANVSQNASVTDGEWVLLQGVYTQSVTPGEVLNVYVEMANPSPENEPRTILVDDFKIDFIKSVPGPNPNYELPSIAKQYEDLFPIGNIMNPGDFADEERLKFLKHHNVLLSAENGMKPEYAYGRDGNFNFTEMDRLMNNALSNGFDVHGHVLVWHSQSPTWQHTDPVTNESLPKEEALDNLREHVRTVVEHYGEDVISWDVVNEAVEDSLLSNPTDWESTLRRSGWWRATGSEFIYEAFLEARKVINEKGWDIELYYNDYNDDNQAKATAIAAMVSDLNARYQEEFNTDQLLVDGIGMQSHYNLNTNPENVRASIERFIDVGVKVGITELDVMAGSGGAQTEQQAKAQAYLYAQLFKIYKEYAEHITRVTFWGIDDQTSWRAENSPLIFDGRYQVKPSYFAVIDPEGYIAANPPEEKVYLKSEAKYGTPEIDGEVDSVWANAPRLEIDRYQQAHNGAKGFAKVLWDDENLYVLIESNDTELDDSSSAAHEQDSVEVFIDENNAKSSSYQADDAQYRVNYKNVASFNPAAANEGFDSKVFVEGTSYRVEMKIPFKTITPENDTVIGFDTQINDASEGARRSVAIWNDITGAGWQDPSVFGKLTLKGKPGLPVPGGFKYHETFTTDPTASNPVRSGSVKSELVTDVTFAGNDDGHALYLYDRENTWDGLDFLYSSLGLQNGVTYDVTIRGYVEAGIEVPEGAVASLQPIHIANSTYSAGWVASAPLVAGQPFTLSGSFTADTATHAELRIGSNEDGAGVPFYIGDVLITSDAEVVPPSEPEELMSFDFEDNDLNGWVRRNGAGNIEVTDEANFTEGGQYSLKTTVSEQYDGALKSVVGLMNRNEQYRLSARVKMAEGQTPTTFRISVQYGSSSYANVSQNANVTDSEWVLLEGLYTQSVTPGDILNVYVEMANASGGEARTILVDDVKIEYVQTLPGINPDYDLASLNDVYKDYFPIGNIMNPGDFTDEDRLEFLKYHNVLLSAENGMKPEYAYNSEGELDFTEMDRLMDNALENEFKVHGHVLVWHSQSPTWQHTDPVTNEPLEKDVALDNLRTHVRAVVEHYGEDVISWDVVNEAIEDSLLSNPTDWKSTLRRSGWWRATGSDFIYEAFLEARKVINENDWDIELYYNDYNEDTPAKATAIATMVAELNAKYKEENDTDQLLIDGIGMQSHHHVTRTKPENVRAAIDKFIAAGVKVGVTELDIMAGEGGVQTEDQALAQAYLYAQLFQIYKEYAEHITRVTFWGIDDQTSWRSVNSPLIFDGRLQAKPSYYAVIDPETFLETYEPPVLPENRESEAKYGTPKIDGEVDNVWENAPRLELDRYQQAHNGAKGFAKVLWDDKNLYVLVESNDTDLDDSSAQAHEQDSVEVFLDENNAKSSSYQVGDGQYRVNFNNISSFNPTSASEGFESSVEIGDSFYRVEMKIPFKSIKPANNKVIGFDAQINDASGGERNSVAIWNDMGGSGWQNPSVFGTLTLTGKPSSPPPSGYVPPSDNNILIPKPPVTVTDGQAHINLTADYLKQTLNQAATLPNGKKQIVIDIATNETVTGSTINLPKSYLSNNENVVIALKTPQGTIEIPGNMLSGLQGIDAETITISISSVNANELDEATREQIGNRPIIKLNVLVNGKVINWSNPVAPVTVSIPYTPTEAEKANSEHIVVWYIDETGKVTAVPNSIYDAANGVVRFQTTHFSKFAISYNVKTFDDIANIAWARKAIEVMASRDIINGVSAHTFNPTSEIKRADFIALLVRALELKDNGAAVTMFNDVKSTDYFYNEVRIAKQLGIANGMGDNLFNPHDSITRQDAMVLVVKAMAEAGIVLNGGSLDGFADASEVSDYAKHSAAALVKSDIINGIDGSIVPKGTLTRAQAAVILYAIWKY